MSRGNTHTPVAHRKLGRDGNSQPENILINTRRVFLTEFGLGSIAASVLIGAAGHRSAMAQTAVEGPRNPKSEVQDLPDLLVMFDPQSRTTLVGLGTERQQQDGSVTFSAMAIEGSPTPIFDFQFEQDFLQQLEDLPVSIPGISTINIEGFNFKLRVDIDPMNEDVASGTLTDTTTLLHVDFLVRQFELQSPFSIRRFLRRVLPVLVVVAVFVVTSGTVRLPTNWLDCVERAIQGCGGRGVLQTHVLFRFPPLVIECNFTCRQIIIE
jgi:hypothetical protein